MRGVEFGYFFFLTVDNITVRNSVQPRRWGMMVQVTDDGTGSNNTTWVLVKGLSNTDINDNANWQTIANYAGGSTPPGGTPNQLQFNNAGAFGGFGAWDNAFGYLTLTGRYQSSNIFPFQALSTSDACDFIVKWVTSSVANSGVLTQGVDVFISDAAVELQDKSALVEYNVTLTKADGSDCVIKRILVGYRKDGAADPVQVGAASEIFTVGNVTPTITFSIGAGLPEININDNGSGGWKVQVWAKVSRSN